MGLKIIGFPIGINDPKYPRNRLIFNLCFVCSASLRTTQYEPIVRKLANYLIHLELEFGFLSDDQKKSKLPLILSQIKDQLNGNRVCSIAVCKASLPINSINDFCLPSTLSPLYNHPFESGPRTAGPTTGSRFSCACSSALHYSESMGSNDTTGYSTLNFIQTIFQLFSIKLCLFSGVTKE